MSKTFSLGWAYYTYQKYVVDLLKLAPHESIFSVTYAFWRYEEEFFVPPDDAFHSILRKARQGQPLSLPPVEPKVMEEDIPNELR